MAEDDWDGWKLLTERLGEQRPAGRRRPLRHQPRAACAAGIELGVGNSILIKVNQIGTLTETLEAIAHRPRGRLHDGHLAPLRRDRGHDDRRPRRRHRRRARSRPARPSRSDRVAKYNRLLRIEEELGAAAEFPGLQAFVQQSK